MLKITPKIERELNNDQLFELKRHLILSRDENANSYPIGKQNDFENTAVRIYPDDSVFREFQESHFTKIPSLKERRWLVLCTSTGIYPIYNEKNLDKLSSTPLKVWRILKIPKALYAQLVSDINFEKRIVYTSYTSKEYKNLSAARKEMKYYPIDKIRAVNRIEGRSCCTLL